MTLPYQPAQSQHMPLVIAAIGRISRRSPLYSRLRRPRFASRARRRWLRRRRYYIPLLRRRRATPPHFFRRHGPARCRHDAAIARAHTQSRYADTFRAIHIQRRQQPMALRWPFARRPRRAAVGSHTRGRHCLRHAGTDGAALPAIDGRRISGRATPPLMPIWAISLHKIISRHDARLSRRARLHAARRRVDGATPFEACA